MVTSVIIWLLCVGISAILIAYVLKGNNFDFFLGNEGFTTNIIMTTCPPESSQYITPGGDTNCCDGDIVNKQCTGTSICSLSPNPSNGLKSCSDWINSHWLDRANRFCPTSMPNYFGPIKRGAQGKLEGCSESHSSPDGSSPQDITQPQCKIYSTEADEYGKVDSCLNRKELDAMVAPGEKSVVKTPNGAPALLIATGISTGGNSDLLITCYDYKRYIQFLRTSNPTAADALTKDPCIYNASLNMCGIKCPAK